ncbi:uncharacterized protein LOC143213484 isoform X3 [Lasioglossum baleicum]|uniref:uncharacterized protein LOC143213484 isoform X3 n=1 Tax=Lasioglossum baleicum TaxID=434251 RepID=UPI003FCCEF9A
MDSLNRPSKNVQKRRKHLTTSSDEKPGEKFSRSNMSQRLPLPAPRPISPSIARLMHTLEGMEKEAVDLNPTPTPQVYPPPTLPSLPAVRKQVHVQLLKPLSTPSSLPTVRKQVHVQLLKPLSTPPSLSAMPTQVHVQLLKPLSTPPSLSAMPTQTQALLQAVLQHLDTMKNDMKERFNEMNRRFDETNQRIDDTNQRIDETNQRIDETNRLLEYTKNQEAERRAEQKAISDLLHATAERQDLIMENLDAQRRVMQSEQQAMPPHFLPFQTAEEVLAFETSPEPEYEGAASIPQKRWSMHRSRRQ